MKEHISKKCIIFVGGANISQKFKHALSNFYYTFFYVLDNIVNITIPNLEGTCLFAFFAIIVSLFATCLGLRNMSARIYTIYTCI